MPGPDDRGQLALLICLALGGCGDAAPDPLDPELIRELSSARGSATGDAHSGAWALAFELESCDCPSVELDATLVDLCTLVSFAGQGFAVQLSESGGVLAIPSGPDASFGVLTGAMQSDGSFNVAAHHDASTLAGPLESLARMDGRFDTDNSVAGWAGQRLIGEVPGGDLDCRWIGSFVGTRL